MVCSDGLSDIYRDRHVSETQRERPVTPELPIKFAEKSWSEALILSFRHVTAQSTFALATPHLRFILS